MPTKEQQHIRETLGRLDALAAESHLPAEERDRLRALLGELRTELQSLTGDEAPSGLGPALSAVEQRATASSSGLHPGEILDFSLQEAEQSFVNGVESLEAHHPKIAEVLGRVGLALARMGV